KDEFLYILSAIYFLLMTWPFVAIKNMDFPKAIIIYIFGIWLSLILILFIRAVLLRKGRE
ncbi:hypothetical protein, partial [Bacteriovorax sp. DB6_IX]|uniref:hypothetical protein n=1 Tax=Bacteriovorax sp. DB6_IX TaxID=1353530 RepID=UPI00038A1F76